MGDYFEEQNLVNLNHILCDEQEKGGAMTNREKFKEELCDIVITAGSLAVNKRTLKPCKCSCIECMDCIAYNRDCRDAMEEWANSEYVEPCQFKKNELVEVSDDGIKWKLRYFSHQEAGLFYCYDSGYTSQKTDMDFPWVYCQKYGTLGGLINSDGSTTDCIRDEGEGYVR